MEEFVFKLIEAGGAVGGVIAVVILSQRQVSAIITSFQAQMDERLKMWVEHLDKRDQEWRVFLAEQRGISVETQEKLAAEISANTKAIRELVDASQKHHVYTQDSFDSVRRLMARKAKRAVKT